MEKKQYLKIALDITEDDRIDSLIEDLSAEGWGIYTLLLHTLRRRPKYRFNVHILKVITRKYMLSEESVRRVTQDYDLFRFVKEGGETYLVSPELYETIEMPSEKEPARVAGGKKRASTAKRATNGRFAKSPSSKRNTIVVEEVVEEVVVDISAYAAADAENKREKKRVVAAKREIKEATHPHRNWKECIAQAVAEEEWLELLTTQAHIPMHHTNTMVEQFERHVKTQGTEGNIRSVKDAKSYMSNFYRPGSATYKRVVATLSAHKERNRKSNPHRFEEIDHTTGERYYCGILIPHNAPPRPDENAIWLNNEWTR